MARSSFVVLLLAALVSASLLAPASSRFLFQSPAVEADAGCTVYLTSDETVETAPEDAPEAASAYLVTAPSAGVKTAVLQALSALSAADYSLSLQLGSLPTFMAALSRTGVLTACEAAADLDAVITIQVDSPVVAASGSP